MLSSDSPVLIRALCLYCCFFQCMYYIVRMFSGLCICESSSCCCCRCPCTNTSTDKCENVKISSHKQIGKKKTVCFDRVYRIRHTLVLTRKTIYIDALLPTLHIWRSQKASRQEQNRKALIPYSHPFTRSLTSLLIFTRLHTHTLHAQHKQQQQQSNKMI